MSPKQEIKTPVTASSSRVIDRVWELYKLSDSLSGGRATLLEWDDAIPSFEVVHAEALKARAYINRRPERKLPAARAEAVHVA